MWIVGLVVLAGLLLGGVWIGIVLGLSGIVILYMSGGTAALTSAVPAAWNILYNYSFAAMPMYIFLAEVFVASGLASKSYDSLSPLLERLPGKLLVVNLALDTIFGAVVGSSTATTATVGAIAYPELTKRGYNRREVLGNLAGAGTLGSFVPPSLGLIIYGSWVDISVGRCFAAALIPALITSALFFIYLVVRCSLRADIAPAAGEIVPLRRAITATGNIWPMAVLMASVMGAIYLGVATAVEAAGLATIIAIIMSIGFKTFSFNRLRRSLDSTIRVAGMIMLVLAGGTIFSISLSTTGLPRQIVLAVQDLGLPPWGTIGFIYTLYLVLGCFFHFIPMLLMTLPFTFPLAMNCGFDPFWFGVALTILGEIGLLTPPVGTNLFVLQGLTRGAASLEEVSRGSLPYTLILCVTLILVTLFPELTSWLPNRMK